MNADAQTWIALGVVGVTVALMLWGRWRRKRSGKAGCDCPIKKDGFR